MPDPQRRILASGALTAQLVAERFPTYRATLHEAARKPGPVLVPGMDPAALVDNDLACARRRRILLDALDTAPMGSVIPAYDHTA